MCERVCVCVYVCDTIQYVTLRYYEKKEKMKMKKRMKEEEKAVDEDDYSR